MNDSTLTALTEDQLELTTGGAQTWPPSGGEEEDSEETAGFAANTYIVYYRPSTRISGYATV